MHRVVHVIESNEGYLCDIEKYTSDICAAVIFENYDSATTKLKLVSDKLSQTCWVRATYLKFPHPTGIS
jgi:hypothetical protein